MTLENRSPDVRGGHEASGGDQGRLSVHTTGNVIPLAGAINPGKASSGREDRGQDPGLDPDNSLDPDHIDPLEAGLDDGLSDEECEPQPSHLPDISDAADGQDLSLDEAELEEELIRSGKYERKSALVPCARKKPSKDAAKSRKRRKMLKEKGFCTVTVDFPIARKKCLRDIAESLLAGLPFEDVLLEHVTPAVAKAALARQPAGNVDAVQTYSASSLTALREERDRLAQELSRAVDRAQVLALAANQAELRAHEMTNDVHEAVAKLEELTRELHVTRRSREKAEASSRQLTRELELAATRLRHSDYVICAVAAAWPIPLTMAALFVR